MMQGDDIRNHRMEVEQIDKLAPSLDGKRVLALWTIAEQLYEIRALFGIVVDSDRKEINIFVNGGSVEATGGK